MRPAGVQTKTTAMVAANRHTSPITSGTDLAGRAYAVSVLTDVRPAEILEAVDAAPADSALLRAVGVYDERTSWGDQFAPQLLAAVAHRTAHALQTLDA